MEPAPSHSLGARTCQNEQCQIDWNRLALSGSPSLPNFDLVVKERVRREVPASLVRVCSFSIVVSPTFSPLVQGRVRSEVPTRMLKGGRSPSVTPLADTLRAKSRRDSRWTHRSCSEPREAPLELPAPCFLGACALRDTASASTLSSGRRQRRQERPLQHSAEPRRWGRPPSGHAPHEKCLLRGVGFTTALCKEIEGMKNGLYKSGKGNTPLDTRQHNSCPPHDTHISTTHSQRWDQR